MVRKFLLICFVLVGVLLNESWAISKSGTVISNTAICTYVSPDGNRYTQLSNTVETVVAQVYGVLIEPNKLELDSSPGSFVEFPFLLENTGNGKDRFTVAVENLSGDSGDLKNCQIFYDENGNGKVDIGEKPISETDTLQPGQVVSLVLRGKVPVDILKGRIDLQIIGRSLGDKTKEDSNNLYSVVISEGGFLTIKKYSNMSKVKPGERFSYTVSFENTGSKDIKGARLFTDFDNDGSPEERRGILVFDALPNGFIFKNLYTNLFNWVVVYKGTRDSYWKRTISDISGSLKYVGLLSPENAEFSASEFGKFTIDGYLSSSFSGTVLKNKAYGLYSSNGKRKFAESNTAVVNVEPLIKVIVDDTDDGIGYSGSGKPDDQDDLTIIKGISTDSWAVFKNEAWNLGSRTDVVNLTVDKSLSQNLSGLTVKFYDTSGRVLTDSDGDGLPDTGPIPPGGRKVFYTKVFIPPNYSQNSFLVAIKGISSIDPDIYDYTYDKAENVEKVEVVLKAKVVSIGGLSDQVVKNRRVIAYEYAPNGKLVRKKVFITDGSGFISLDSSGAPLSLYSWMRSGYIYRITLKKQDNGQFYYLSPPIEKRFLNAVDKPGDSACWNWQMERVDCSDKSAVIKAVVNSDGTRVLKLPLDPAGYVYDAVTGKRIDGACVRFYKCSDSSCSSYTLVDPSRLDFYPDGATKQENPQVSGPTDVNGNSVGLGDGDFAFQIANFTSSDVGWYFITVDYNCNYPASDKKLKDKYRPVYLKKDSVWSPYSGKPYTGQKFYVDYSFPGAVALRIPLMPKGFKQLEVKKSVSSSTAYYGDLVKWSIEVKNPNSFDVYGVRVYDYLPRGFRYKGGTTKVDGEKFKDPSISSSGGSLTWNLGKLKAGESREVTFYTYVTPGAKEGKRKNTARASGWIDSSKEISVSSNEAYAYVNIVPGVFTSRGYIIGRVFLDNNKNGILDEGEPGVGGVKIYMEDGRFVVTDSEGKYHFDNVRAGTHVLKVDKTTIPSNTVLAITGNRNAGDPNSLFVDLFPGELFKANFRLIPLPAKVNSSISVERAVSGKVSVERGIAAVLVDPKDQTLMLKHCFCLKNGVSSPLYEVKLTEISPFLPESGTVKLNGAPFKDPQIKENNFSWYLPVVEPKETVCLTWLSKPVSKETDVKSVVYYSLKPYDGKAQKVTAAIPVIFSVKSPKTYEIQVYFDFGSYRLSEDAKKSLKALADFLRKNDYKQIFIRIVGHTDSVRVSKSSRRYRNNKELSLKRAKAVEHFLRELLIDTRKVKIDFKE